MKEYAPTGKPKRKRFLPRESEKRKKRKTGRRRKRNDCGAKRKATWKSAPPRLPLHFAATARLDVKKIMLAARKKAVENVYAEAKKRLIDLGEEETLTLFNRLLCLYAEEGDAVIFADGFRYAEGVKLLPVFAQKKLKAVSDGAAFAGVKIDGGLYLAGKTADKDLSFDALLKADREENESRIAAELFGSPAKEKSE